MDGAAQVVKASEPVIQAPFPPRFLKFPFSLNLRLVRNFPHFILFNSQSCPMKQMMQLQFYRKGTLDLKEDISTLPRSHTEPQVYPAQSSC